MFHRGSKSSTETTKAIFTAASKAQEAVEYLMHLAMAKASQ